MKHKKWFWLLALLVVLGGLLVACGDLEEDEYYDEDEAAYYEDEEFSSEDEEFFSEDEEAYNEDEEGFYSEDEEWDEWEVMTAEDCYDDEYYDEEDQTCYLLYDCDEDPDSCEELDDEFYTLAGELIDIFLSEDYEWVEGSPDEVIIRYAIRNNELIDPELGAVTDELVEYQNDSQTHEQLWVYFANLIPADERRFISHFGFFTDGQGEVLAYVEPNIDNPNQWVLYVDIQDAQDTEELTYTLIHEYAHIMSLNSTQVPFDAEAYYDENLYEEAESSCPTYFTGEGCSRPNSYINAFFEAFWADIYEESLEYGDDVESFYEEYEDQFVTDYAATNPAEDIAESFTFFVMQSKPEGDTIAEEKILFFYDYPELLQLRAEIAGRAYARLRR